MSSSGENNVSSIRKQAVTEVRPLWLTDCDVITIGTVCLPPASRYASTVRFAVAETRRQPEDIATGVTQDPPFPFHTISIDHKTVTAPRSKGYQYILVVVDMLTAFVTAIPTKTMSAEETLTALMQQVFAKYSFPSAIKSSDNEIAFRNELIAYFSKFAGFRNAYVLPYNAQANDMAEQSVGRIARLTVEHTQQFSNWSATLPMVTFALNCIDPLSKGTSPFSALYGRHSISLPELENPHLLEVTETGHEFVDSLAFKSRQAWSAIRDISKSIRAVAAAKSDSH
eukprot:6177909-Pleurochrysis_carterae.AAC.4